MSHIHWVARQNKLEIPRDKDCVYYESIKRDLKRRLIYEYRCYERLKTKTEECTRLADTKDEVVYYESIKREPKIRGIKKCRCDEVNKREIQECRLFFFHSFFYGGR